MELTVGVFGLGLMGRPVARRLLGAGWQVVGWNRSLLAPEMIEGIPVVDSLPAAARQDICLLMLADSSAVDEVLGRLAPELNAGQLVLDMGSSEPQRSREHARKLAARGIGWVDAPVSGGPVGAEAGALAIMVGGMEADVERAWPVLEALGGNVTHVGGAGAGHAVKVINQLIVALTIEAVAEAMVLGEQAGLQLSLLQQALRGGLADSSILQHHGSRMIRRQYIPGGKAKTQLKDLRMAQRMAASSDLRLPHLESCIKMFQAVVDEGDGELDHSVLHKWVDLQASLRDGNDESETSDE